MNMIYAHYSIFLSLLFSPTTSFTILSSHKLTRLSPSQLILQSTVIPPSSSTTDNDTEDDDDKSEQNQQYVASSHVYEKDIPFLIENLAPDNFEVSLEFLQPLLKSECDDDLREDYLSKLKDKTASIGKQMPEDFASSLT